jgi:hypothetical protein
MKKDLILGSIFATAFWAYCALWLYVLYPLLDNLWKGV